ncbi:MAG: hypothetical protein GY786_07725, partial [Proteobacteria bacterium]|nr:hypothetical protein [Pseudomonadota bacterium]
MSSIPHVIENFVACGARILAAEVVKEESSGFSDRLVEDTLVWCGTMS